MQSSENCPRQRRYKPGDKRPIAWEVPHSDIPIQVLNDRRSNLSGVRWLKQEPATEGLLGLDIAELVQLDTNLRLGGDMAQTLEIARQPALSGSVNYIRPTAANRGDGSKTDDTSVVSCQQDRKKMADDCHDGEQIDVDEPSSLVNVQGSDIVVPGRPNREEQPLDFTESLRSGNNFLEEFLGAHCVSCYDFNLYAVSEAQMRRLRLKVTGVAGDQKQGVTARSQRLAQRSPHTR
jgi:hypothetical protein